MRKTILRHASVIAIVFSILTLGLIVSTLPTAKAAVGFDAFTTDASTANRGQSLFSHTVAEGSNRLIIVSVGMNTNAATSEPSDVEVNGVAATEINNITQGCCWASWLFYYISPPTGSVTIAVNYTAVTQADIVAAMSFVGVHQATPIGTNITANGIGSVLTAVLSTGSPDSWIVGAGQIQGADGDPFTPGSGETEIFDLDTGGGSASADIAATGVYAITTTSGAHTVSSTASVSDDFTWNLAEIRDAGAVPAISLSHRQCGGPLDDLTNRMQFISNYATSSNITADCDTAGTFYGGTETGWTQVLDTTTYDWGSLVDRFYGNGTILHIYRIATAHEDNLGSINLRYSEDGGLTWTSPREIFNTSLDDRNFAGGIAFDDSITIALTRYDAVATTFVDWGWIRSTDGGLTWTSYLTFPVWSADVSHGNHHGPLIKLDNGTIGITYYEWNDPGNIGRIRVRWSDDYGATWPRLVTAHPNDGKQTVEPNGVYLGNGRILVMFADWDDSSDNFYQVTSSDYGENWTAVAAIGASLPTGGTGHGPWTIRQYDKVLTVYRTSGLGSFQSHGWANITEIMGNASAWNSLGSLTTDFDGHGYGGQVALDNGSILFIESWEESNPLQDSDQDYWTAFGNPVGMALRLGNTGTVVINITLSLVANPPSGITLKWNSSSYEPAIGQSSINTTATQVCTNLALGAECYVWLWTDFQGATLGTFTTNLNAQAVEFSTGDDGEEAGLPIVFQVGVPADIPTLSAVPVAEYGTLLLFSSVLILTLAGAWALKKRGGIGL